MITADTTGCAPSASRLGSNATGAVRRESVFQQWTIEASMGASRLLLIWRLAICIAEFNRASQQRAMHTSDRRGGAYPVSQSSAH